MSFTVEQLTEWQGRYRNDLGLFVRDMWNVEPDAWQQEVADKLSKDETRRLAIPSGHGVGKTALAAWTALWFVTTRFPCKVPITAPSAATLEDGLFAEIKLWLGRMPAVVANFLEATHDRVVLKSAPESAFISVRTARADKPDALQGIHADYVLLIVDEASGVPDPVFESSQGSMSGLARYMMLLGNPIRASGYFNDAITVGKGIWWVRTVSCLEAKRAPQEYIDEMAAIYGEDSNTYRTRVLGLPPLSDDDTIIPLHMIHAAYDRAVEPVQLAPRIWGLDVGGLNGGESALTERQGNWVPTRTERFRGINQMQLVGRIAATFEGRPVAKRPYRICVDAIGMGAAVVERLRELGLPAVGVNVSESSAMTDRYHNLKAELWWKARAWFEGQDCRFPGDDSEITKALSCVRIKYHSTGRLLCESKDEMKRRMKSRCPRMDAADSFILTFAGPASIAIHGREPGMKQSVRRGLAGIV